MWPINPNEKVSFGFDGKKEIEYGFSDNIIY